MPLATHAELSETQRALREAARAFASERLAPGAIARDRDAAFSRDLYREAAAAGFVGVKVPEPLGGRGLGLFEECLVLEELAGGDASLALTISVSAGLCGGHLLRHASQTQHERWIPPLMEGAIGAWAITERGAGSHAAALACAATRRGDSYVLNGAKMFVTQGVDFDALLVLARTAEGKGGVSAFLVDRADAGRRSVALEGVMGMTSSGAAEVFFENCALSAERRIGAEGEGLRQARGVLDDGRVVLGAMCVGIAQASLDAAAAHAKEREAFGKRVADFAGLRGMMAESAIEISAAREMVANAAKLRDLGEDNAREVAMTKLFASEACLRVCDRGIQIHGGYGYVAETRAGLFWRDARVFTLGEGTSELHRNLVSRHLFET